MPRRRFELSVQSAFSSFSPFRCFPQRSFQCVFRLRDIVLPNDQTSGDKWRIYHESLLPCWRSSLEVVGRSAITGKFQVTLPKSVREFLKADNGDFLVFIKDYDTIVVKRGRVNIED